MKNQSSNNGQSLIEMLAAIAVMIIVILALVAITTAAIRNASFARNQASATKYAQEGIEKARQLRDSQTEDLFFVNDNGSCNASDIPDTARIFNRQRTCVLSVNGEIKTMTVTVTVIWTDSKGIHKSEMITNLSNWK